MKKGLLFVLTALAIAALILSGCKAAPTPEPTEPPPPPATEPPPPPATEPPPPPEPELGSPERPIQVYFVPSAEVDQIVAGGEVLRAALADATGLSFEVYVPTSYAAAIEGMCAAPADTMGFPATLAYVIANARCGVDVSHMSVRYGWNIYWAQYLVRRDSGITSFADLDGKSWGATDATSTSGYLIPLLELGSAGVTPSETVFTGGHTQSVLAVYNGDVDFSTSYYSAPLQPEAEGTWDPDEDVPEPWADFVDDCALDDEGAKIFCGEYRVLDARSSSGVRSVAPDIMQEVGILTLSASIPNDCMAFGPDFDPELRALIETTMETLMGSEAWDASVGDFYSWSEMIPATDADYDIVRDMVSGAGVSMDDLVGMLEE